MSVRRLRTYAMSQALNTWDALICFADMGIVWWSDGASFVALPCQLPLWDVSL